MRLIDADAFKNYIQNGLEDVRYFFKDNGKRAEKVIEGICEDIDEQPTIELPKWIPCSERLPENDDDVLVQMNDGSMMVDFTAAFSNGWFWAEVGDEPVAWMPLPSPYQGGADNDRA